MTSAGAASAPVPVPETTTDDAGVVSTQLDPALFQRQRTVLAVRVPLRQTQTALKALKPVLLTLPHLVPVRSDEQSPSTHKLLLLDAEESLPERAQAWLQGAGQDACSVTSVHVDVTYRNLSYVQAVQLLLPPGVDVPHAFETVGHIAHVNLRDEHQSHRFAIGQVLLDKNPKLRSVVNKVGTIQSVYRNFKLELLAGVPDMQAEVREHGCVFRFNYANVYWNSRLGHEHARLVASFTARDVVADVFAGVGPFAVPAARRGIHVHANDLNPDSVSALEDNLRRNKIPNGRVRVYNMDGRAFIRQLIAEPHVDPAFTQVVMNLPADALEFLDAFSGYTSPVAATVHCYCFTAALSAPETDIIPRAEAALGRPLLLPKLHHVRDVAPKKHMYCLSFSLAAASALGKRSASDLGIADGETAKRCKA